MSTERESEREWRKSKDTSNLLLHAAPVREGRDPLAKLSEVDGVVAVLVKEREEPLGEDSVMAAKRRLEFVQFDGVVLLDGGRDGPKPFKEHPYL